MKVIKVTGYIYVEDNEYDPGPMGPLTEAAFEEWSNNIGLLNDLEFELSPGEG